MARFKDNEVVTSAREALVDEPDFFRDILQATLQRLLEEEISTHLNADPHERTSERRGYRNEYRERQLKTRMETLQLLVPLDRVGTFRTELFDRYQRSEKALVSTLMEKYLEGASTRKVKHVTEVLCGTSFSKSTVSRLTGELDGDLSAWRERRLDTSVYPYLVVDARYEHVRVAGRIVSQGVLIVKDVREDGQRELLAVDVADSESAVAYDALLRRSKERGLQGVQHDSYAYSYRPGNHGTAQVFTCQLPGAAPKDISGAPSFTQGYVSARRLWCWSSHALAASTTARAAFSRPL